MAWKYECGCGSGCGRGYDIDADPDDEVWDRRDARAAEVAEARGRADGPTPPGQPRAVDAILRHDALVPSLGDEYRPYLEPGRTVPIGYARYQQPGLNLEDWRWLRLAGWRVAVPRRLSQDSVDAVLRNIYYAGPQSQGYVRDGDALVPAILSPGDRATLAQDARGYATAPLSL